MLYYRLIFILYIIRKSFYTTSLNRFIPMASYVFRGYRKRPAGWNGLTQTNLSKYTLFFWHFFKMCQSFSQSCRPYHVVCFFETYFFGECNFFKSHFIGRRSDCQSRGWRSKGQLVSNLLELVPNLFQLISNLLLNNSCHFIRTDLSELQIILFGTQQTNTCLKTTIETQKKDVKCVQS